MESPLEQQYNSRFEEDFEFKKIIGNGGFGIVLHVKDTTDNHEYAIKRIPLRSEKKRKLAKREAEIMAALSHDQHEYIVRYYNAFYETPPPGWQEARDITLFPELSDYCSSSETCSSLGEEKCTYMYIKLELCKIETLQEWLRKDRERMEQEKLTIFKQITAAVAYLHREGYIHRDIKPSNILFGRRDHKVKLGDFGLAKICEVLSDDGDCCPKPNTTSIGTDFYLSPEQKEKREYSNKVDIYALGLVLVELYNHFTTDLERYKEASRIREDFTFPEMFQANYPEHYDLARKMLQKNPDDRISAEDIMHHSVFTGEPLLHHPIPASQESPGGQKGLPEQSKIFAQEVGDSGQDIKQNQIPADFQSSDVVAVKDLSGIGAESKRVLPPSGDAQGQPSNASSAVTNSNKDQFPKATGKHDDTSALGRHMQALDLSVPGSKFVFPQFVKAPDIDYKAQGDGPIAKAQNVPQKSDLVEDEKLIKYAAAAHIEWRKK